MKIAPTVLAAPLIAASLWIAGCAADPIAPVSHAELSRLAHEPGVRLQYMGSDGIYHYIDRPEVNAVGHVSYRIPRTYLKLDRTFPRGQNARYELDATTIDSGATVSTPAPAPEAAPTPEAAPVPAAEEPAPSDEPESK